jgi:hypothetical protein
MSAPTAAEILERVERERRLTEEIIGWFRVLLDPGQVVELRAIGIKKGDYPPHTEAGFFDAAHLPQMVKAARRLSEKAPAVYWTLNPLDPDLLARRKNRTDWAKTDELATDRDVLRRRWLLIDADPVRRAKISSTGAEKAFAWETIQAVRDHLGGRGWPAPILADSGNGFHLLYRIDLPADDGGTVRKLLHALGDRFDTDKVKIDRTVFNPSRICKFYGTMARKGDPTETRPHRLAKLLPEACQA